MTRENYATHPQGDVRAPFTEHQVYILNQFQHAGFWHPFTCGKRSEHRNNEGVLYAMPDGWHCPAGGCDYTQDWAHAFMADEETVTKMQAAHDRLWADLTEEDAP